MFSCCAPTRAITQDAGEFSCCGVRFVDDLSRRDGPGHSLPPNPPPTLVLYTNLAIVSVKSAVYPQSRPSSPSSTFLVSTLSASPTASVIRQAPLFSVALSSCVSGGSLQRGRGRALCSLSGCSISFTNFKRRARSACMTHTPPLPPSQTLRAWGLLW